MDRYIFHAYTYYMHPRAPVKIDAISVIVGVKMINVY